MVPLAPAMRMGEIPMRALPLVLALALLLYGLFDALQTEESRIRTLPKVMWIVVMVVIPIIGPILWLILGRPEGQTEHRASFRRQPVAPDDDPLFLDELRHAEHDKMLEQWEDEFRRREGDVREPHEDDDPQR